MEHYKEFDLKNMFFYYLISWRMIIVCVILSVSLVFGYSFFRKRYIDTESNGITTDISDKELEELEKDFGANNPEAKRILAKIDLEKNDIDEIDALLENDYYLKIDPNNRIIKSFVLDFNYINISAIDEEAITRTSQTLSLQYLKYMSNEEYFKYISSKGMLRLNAENIINLIKTNINRDGNIRVEVTGPSEFIVDQLIQNSKDYFEKVVHPSLDIIEAHLLFFEDESSEIIKDNRIVLLKQELQEMIESKKSKIDSLSNDLELIFEDYLKSTASINIKSSKSAFASYIVYLFIGLFIGLLISLVISIVRNWRRINTFDISLLAGSIQIPYIGMVECLSDDQKNSRVLPGTRIDKIIIRLFDMEFDNSKRIQNLNYAAHYLLGKFSQIEQSTYSHERVTLAVPDTAGSILKSNLINSLEEQLNNFVLGENYIELNTIGDISNEAIAIDALSRASGLILLWTSTDDIDKCLKEYQVGRMLDKDILGVLEIVPKQ